MVADGKLTQQRRGHRRHAARLYPARLGALDQRDPFLEHLDGRVLEPRIGHADLVAAEARRDALGAVIAVAGGQEQRLRRLAMLAAPCPAAHRPRRGVPVARRGALETSLFLPYPVLALLSIVRESGGGRVCWEM